MNCKRCQKLGHAEIICKEKNKRILKKKTNAQRDWKIYQMDLKSAFLNGWCKEEIYVEQLKGFVQTEHVQKVLFVQKGFTWTEASSKSLVWQN